MKKQVLVTGCSKFYGDGESETSEFFAEGLLYNKSDKYYLMFDTVYDDENIVKTTLIVHSPNNVTLKNSGNTNYRIDLQEHVPYDSIISFDGVSLSLEIHPEKILCEISPDGYGNNYMKYLIKGNGLILSENIVDMKITPKTK